MAKAKRAVRAARGAAKGKSDRLPVVALAGQRKARAGHEENPDRPAIASKEDALKALTRAWFDEYVQMGDVTIRRRALYVANTAALEHGALPHEIEGCAGRAWHAALNRVAPEAAPTSVALAPAPMAAVEENPTVSRRDVARDTAANEGRRVELEILPAAHLRPRHGTESYFFRGEAEAIESAKIWAREGRIDEAFLIYPDGRRARVVSTAPFKDNPAEPMFGPLPMTAPVESNPAESPVALYLARIATHQHYSNQRFDEKQHLAALLTDEDRAAGRKAPAAGYSATNIDRAERMISEELARRGHRPGPEKNPEAPAGSCSSCEARRRAEA